MAYGKKLIHDLATGQQIEVDLTPEEIAAYDARRATAEAEATTLAQQQAAIDADLAPTRTAQIQAALTQIDTDLTTLQASPTNAQVLAIIGRTLQRQRAVIRALARLADRG